MNYIKQLNEFYSQLEYNPMSANAIALWSALMHIANKTRWLEYFTVANKTLELKSGLESNSLKRARNELIQKKLLIYVKGSNKHILAKYKLPVLYDLVDEPIDEHVSEPINEHINKQKEDINKTETKNRELSSLKTSVTQKNKVFIKPTVSEIISYCNQRNNNIDPQRFFDFYESNGWYVGKAKMKDWKASVRTWERRASENYETSNPKAFNGNIQQASTVSKRPLYGIVAK